MLYFAVLCREMLICWLELIWCIWSKLCNKWSPRYKQDIDLIELVQRRFTKRLPGCSNYTYNERLTLLNLPSLELRRLRLDLIWCYKILFGLISIDSADQN